MAPRPDVDVDTVEECVASTSEGPLRVMPSLIPGAGLGLFTGEDVPAGTVLPGCTYGGDVLTFMQARAMRPETKDYVMALHFNVHVDAAMHPGYLARYINDNLADGGRHRNVRFVKDAAERCASVVTTRDLRAGEELYAEYGDGYWRHRAQVHDTVDEDEATHR